jgi:hypothetical protein
LVANQVDTRLESLDQLAVLLGERCSDHHPQPLGSVDHIDAFPVTELRVNTLTLRPCLSNQPARSRRA